MEQIFQLLNSKHIYLWNYFQFLWFNINFYRLHYKTNDLTANPDLIKGNGDGSVNIRSLEGCTRWRGLQKQPISTLEVPNVEHFAILQHPKIVQYVLDVLVN